MDPEELRKRNQTKGLIVIILFFVSIVAIIFVIGAISKKHNNDTPHIEIVKYKGYAFDNHTTNWETTVNLSDGHSVELIQRNPPWELEDIRIIGDPFEFFHNISSSYVTFDPTEEVHTKYTTMAYAELLVLSAHYGFGLTGAYTKEHDDGSGAEVITCGSNTSVIYLNQADSAPEVVVDHNCITITGKDDDLIRATNKLIYYIYGIK